MSTPLAGGAPNKGMTYDNVVARFPWLDYGTFAIPDAWADVILWARYFWMHNGDYRQSMKMVASYFITSLDMTDIGDEDSTAYKDFYENSVNYSSELLGLGLDYSAYGECYRTMFFPVHRSLRCTSCSFEQPIEQCEYTWKNFGFTRKHACPLCGAAPGSALERVDRKDTDMSKVRVNRWDPMLMTVVWSPVSQRAQHWLRIPAQLKRQIKDGIHCIIRDLPWEYVECVEQDKDLEIEESMVFHEYARDITGVMENGRGLPKSVSNFRLFWLIQTLNRQDQAIAIDYITGLRLYAPAPQNNTMAGAGGLANDPVLNRGGSDFVRSMQSIIQQHRADPTKRFTAPHPVSYQFTGGEGKNLSPYDMIAQRKEELLHSSGVPVEFYKLNFSSQGAPMMLRLFESSNSEIPLIYNRFLRWVTNHLVSRFKTPECTIKVKKPRVADDLDRKQALMSLMAGNQIAPSTALEPYGIDDIRAEIRKVFEHQRILAEEQAKNDEEVMKLQDAGILKQVAALPTMSSQNQPPPGAMPGPGGAGPMATQMPGGGATGQNTSLGDLDAQAQEIAQQIVGLPYEQRLPQLRSLRETNKTLHHLVKGKLEELRSQARSQGGQQILQAQMAPGGGTAGPVG